MTKLSAIILCKTSSALLFEMTKKCIESLIKAEEENKQIQIEIILVESDKKYLEKGYFYGNNIKVILPEISFNFNKFLNIGLLAATGDFIALCNNDLVFKKNWFSEILKVKQSNPEILSFCPYDPDCNRISKDIISKNVYVEGYEIQKQMTGWCFVVDRGIFKKIKKFDEQFNFYFADNDYVMTLIKYNIVNVLVCNSLVTHLGGKVTEEIYKTNTSFAIKSYKNDKKRIPRYVIKENMYWILNDEKMMDGIVKFHKKWGSRKMIKLKLIIISYLKKYKLGCLNKFILN